MQSYLPFYRPIGTSLGSHNIRISNVRMINFDMILINTEIPKVTYYYVLILNLNLKRIINVLKVILISKDYLICHHHERLYWSSGLRRSALKHNDYAGCEFESRSRFFFSYQYFHTVFTIFDEMKKVSIILRAMTKQFQFFKML